MKNFNFFEKLWEHGRTLRRVGLVLVMCLITITQVWGTHNLYEVYMVYEFNGTTEGRNYTYRYNDDSSNPVIELGNLTSNTFKIKEIYWKTEDNWKTNRIDAYAWYNMGAGDTKFAEYTNYYGSNNDDQWGDKHELQNTAVNFTVATANTGNSGLFTFSHWYVVNFVSDKDNLSYCANNQKNYNFTFNILPPNATAITATPTGAVSGSGTELDPYIVPYGGNLTIALSGSTKERADDNSSVQYSVDEGSTWGTSSKTFSNVTETSLQNYVFKARCYNSSANLESPTITTKTVYYKAAKGVPVYKFQTKGKDLGTDKVPISSLTTPSPLQTLIGGTLSGAGSSSTQLKYNNTSFDFNGGSTAYLQIGLDNKIKAGDIIRYRHVGSGACTISLQTAKGTTDNQISLTSASATQNKIQTVVITSAQATAFASLNTVYLVRTGSSNSFLLDYFEIYRPDECPSSGTTYKFQVKSDLATENFSDKGMFDINVGNYLTNLNGGLLQGYEGSDNKYITKVNGTGIQIKNNAGFLQIHLDCPLQAKDKIKTIVQGNTAFVETTASRNSSSPAMTIAKSSNSTDYKIQEIPASFVDKSDLYIYRGGNNCQVLYVEITRSVKYNVTYANGGHGTAPEDESAASVTLEDITVDGWKNTGWTANVAVEVGGVSKSAGTVLAPGTEVTLLDNTTFTAQWAQSYLLTYDANGGSDAPSAEYRVAGSAALSSTVPTYTGHLFVGWKANNEGATYAKGANYTMPSEAVTMYAQWEEICFNFVASTGSETAAGTTKTISTASDGYASTLTGGGMTFKGTSTKVGCNTDYGLVLDANDDVVTLSLTSPSAFGVGTKLYCTLYSSNASGDNNKYSGVKIGSNNLTSSHKCTSTTPTQFTQTYTVVAEDGVEGTNSITITRIADGAKVYIKSIVITGCEDVSGFTLTNAVNDAEYGTVSPTSVASIPSGTSTSSSSNTYTVNGTTVTATPAESTAQYTYAFSSWSGLPATVTENATVTANFTRTTNTYTVTWKNGDATLETDEGVAYGTTPTYNGSTPTKASDASNTYAFSGWSPAVGAITGNTTYTAQFTPTAIDYTVTKTLTNCAVKGGEPAIPATMNYGDDLSTTIEATTGFVLPSTISVSGVTSYTWNQATGALTLTDVTGNVSISIVAEEEGDCTPSRLAKVTLSTVNKALSVADSACTVSYDLEHSSGIGGKLGSGDSLVITPATSLQSGDVVTVTIQVGDYSTSRLYMRYGHKNSTDTVSVLTGKTSGNEATCSFTLTKSTSVISFTRATGKSTGTTSVDNQNHTLKSVIISRPCAGDATEYTLTWNANGGSEGSCTGTCTSGSVAEGTTLVAPENPTLSNYTFDGWKTNNDGTGSSAAATMPSANTTYYAAWKQTVTLKTGSQGRGSDKTPYVYLNGTTLSDKTVHSADGYVLEGYYTAESGGTKVLKANGTFAATNVSGYVTSGKWSREGTTTLYAQWTSEIGPCFQFTSGTTKSSSAPKLPVAAGDEFSTAMWTAGSPVLSGGTLTNSSSSSKSIDANSSNGLVFDNSNKKVTVTLSGTGVFGVGAVITIGAKVSDGAKSGTSKTCGFTVGDHDCSPATYTSEVPSEAFTQTYTVVADDGIAGTNSFTIAMASSTAKTYLSSISVTGCSAGSGYTVTYYGNGNTGGSVPTDANTYSEGDDVTVLDNTGSLEKTGYTFDRWNTAADGSGTGYVANDVFDMPDDHVKLYAQWSASDYTITYNLHDGGAGATVSGNDSYSPADDDYDLPTPEWTGHIFQGWYTTYSDGVYSNPVSVLASGSTGNKTFHAKWGTEVAVVWDIEKVSSKLYKGGTGYTVTAEIDDASWDASGDYTKLELSASDGVTLSNITKSINASDKAQVVANFSVADDVEGDKIYFTLSVPAAGDYSAIEDEKEVDLDDCPGGSTTVTLTDFGDQYYTSGPRYGYAYAGSISGAKYIIQSNSSNNKQIGDKDSSAIRVNYSNTYIKVLGPGATTSLADSLFTGVSKISFKWKLFNAGSPAPTATIDVYVGKTKVASAISVSGLKTDPFVAIDDIVVSPALDGAVQIVNTSAAGTNQNLYLDDISITYAGSGGVATSLAWSSSLADKATVNKNDVDPDFRIYALPTPSNAGGPISYSSSDESVATVSSDGTVHILSDGTTTITASMPAYGCYRASSITYSLVVANTCPDTPGTIVDNDGNAIAGNKVSRGACETLTLKLTGHTGSTIAWKKDGVTIVGATSTSYTIPAGNDYSGVYSATVTGTTCALNSTNSITVTTAGGVDPTIFAKEFTVKSGRPFHYRLMQLNKGESVSVKSATSWTENTDFVITKDADNIVYISSKTYEGVSIEADETETITLTISNSCGGSADKEITIHKIEATAKPTVAWIATSTDNTKGVKDCRADQSTSTTLYKYLETYYTMTARNCYWETREDSLVKEYSKYDLVILTDYPNSGTCPSGKSGKSNSYTNAIGQLIDYRPIMTFEAFVAGCPNWGIPTDPSNTKATQKSLTLLCNASDIFGDDTNKFAAGEDIAVTDAASGQALQGFPVASLPDFVFIGKITDSDTKEYIACCERQVNTSARTLIFGLNSALMSNLTNDGKLMVQKFADYLLETNPASIPDCSVIFNGGGADDSWYTTGNWEGGSLPNQYASVRIDAPCEVPSNASPAKVGRIKIHQGGAFTGSLTIKPAGRMIVDKAITRVEGNEYTVHKQTATSDVVIETNEDNQGALIFNNESARTQATVKLYSKGCNDGSYKYQYFASPFTEISSSEFEDAYIYTHAESVVPEWTQLRYGEDVEAFQGLALTADGDAATYEVEGELAPTYKHTYNLTYTSGKSNNKKGTNVVGNSWTAPIQITRIDDSDFDKPSNFEGTVYIYNAGRDAEQGVGKSTNADTSTPGVWQAIPIGTAKTGAWTGSRQIPAYQAFQLKVSAPVKFTIDYNKHVRQSATQGDDNLNEPLHAPRRRAMRIEDVEVLRLCVTDINNEYHAHIYLCEGDEFTENRDRGWEAQQSAGDGKAGKLYAIDPRNDYMMSIARESLEGTPVGFLCGQATEYTITFNETMGYYYLNDMETQQSTLIQEGESYSFTTTKGNHPNRFIISAIPFDKPGIATGVTDLDAEAPKVQKVIYNDKLYIIRGGKVYSAEGQLVK